MSALPLIGTALASAQLITESGAHLDTAAFSDAATAISLRSN